MPNMWCNKDPRHFLSDACRSIIVIMRPRFSLSSDTEYQEEVGLGAVETRNGWNVVVTFGERTGFIKTDEEWNPKWKWIPAPS